MTFKNRLNILKNEIEKAALAVSRNPADIILVAISKQQPIEKILEAYAEGLRDFGENRVQELLLKKAQLPEDIRWHFIGRIQTNKIAKIVELTYLIHSVADLETAKKIAQSSEQQGKLTNLLIQVNTSHELTKSGWSIEQWRSCISELYQLRGIVLRGLMTMAPLTPDAALLHACFRQLRLFSEELHTTASRPPFLLSMGMSHDYLIALQEGSNCLRIGSALFSECC